MRAVDAETTTNEVSALETAIDRSMLVIEFNLDETVRTANDRFLSTFGFTREELAGKHHRELVDPHEAASDAYRAFWTKLNAGEYVAGRFLRFNKSGQPVLLEARYNPIFDKNGKPSKVVKIAIDITSRLEEQQEQTRLKNMIENLPLNIMFADRDLIIRYVNPASRETFKKIAHLLPVPIEEVIGSPLGIFHANPQHQEQILNDPANLPMKAQFHLGSEVIQLNVSAIYDNAGNYTGPMACWSIETERHEIRGQVNNLANVGNSVAGSVNEMAAAMDEISSRIVRNAELAEDTNHQVSDAGSWIHQLSESSQEIGGIVNTIQDLAEQTNLLALNATIESARAGEAGRGFAVVANEVKSLANSTSEATKNIGERIRIIRDNIQRVVDTNKNITTSVAEVNQNSNAVAAAVEEQSAIVQGMKQTSDHLVELADELKKL
ncbi:methyl-accepting chemotaxis protein [Bremerella sp. P1]|uniref:methyl-accepting chemotaxis protein n=1 Tax=Bremerella sp. P1 TaxID=3026424 RepID=UPI0023688C49|nr:PAS domain-containing methyl-accepting chemotaxis protein [Bremerella sp. P1]WDI43439.1 PAS domain-containing methyl-accepting chemotaxis protein [Bremerella sp. P1]